MQKSKKVVKSPAKPRNQFLGLSKEDLEEMLKEVGAQKDLKAQILDRTNKEDLQKQLRNVRRRDYYYKRVKASFAPKNKNFEEDESEESPSPAPDSPSPSPPPGESPTSPPDSPARPLRRSRKKKNAYSQVKIAEHDQKWNAHFHIHNDTQS